MQRLHCAPVLKQYEPTNWPRQQDLDMPRSLFLLLWPSVNADSMLLSEFDTATEKFRTTRIQVYICTSSLHSNHSQVCLVETRVECSDRKRLQTIQQDYAAKRTASLPMSWEVLAGQVAFAGQSLLEHPAEHLGLQEHLEGLGACRHQACSVGVGLCFCGPLLIALSQPLSEWQQTRCSTPFCRS